MHLISVTLHENVKKVEKLLNFVLFCVDGTARMMTEYVSVPGRSIYMGVYFSCGNAFMPKHLLDKSEVSSSFNQVRCE